MTRKQIATDPAAIEDARELLRTLLRICDQRDPAAVAEMAVDPGRAIGACARVQMWLRRYVEALRRRQPQ